MTKIQWRLLSWIEGNDVLLEDKNDIYIRIKILGVCMCVNISLGKLKISTFWLLLYY